MQQRLVIALLCGDTAVPLYVRIVLVSRSRASLGVALSTCQLSLLAVALWMCLPTVGGYPRHVVLRSPSGAEPWHTVLWDPPKGLDYCGCVYPQMLNNMTVDVFTHRCLKDYCGWSTHCCKEIILWMGLPTVSLTVSLWMGVPTVMRNITVDGFTHG